METAQARQLNKSLKIIARQADTAMLGLTALLAILRREDRLKEDELREVLDTMATVTDVFSHGQFERQFQQLLPGYQTPYSRKLAEALARRDAAAATDPEPDQPQ